MPKKHSIISQIELAMLTGTTKQTVNKAINAGHVQVNSKRKVIFDHDLTQLWYQKQISRNKNQETSLKKADGHTENVKKVNLVSLQQQKTIEEIGRIKAERRLKELKFERERGDLIEKQSVASVLFQYLDALNTNMLTVPDMVVDIMIDKIKAGAERGDLIKIMRDAASREIKNTKKAIRERLK